MDSETKQRVLLGDYRLSTVASLITISPPGFVRANEIVLTAPVTMERTRKQAHLELALEAFQVFAETGMTPKEMREKLNNT